MNIHTDAAPNGEIRGQIGCVGTCTPPAQVSTQDPCTPSGSNVIIYQDSIFGWPNWRVDNWGGATYACLSLLLVNHFPHLITARFA